MLTNQNQNVPLFILATEDIGYKRKAGDEIINNIAKMFSVSPQHIQNLLGAVQHVRLCLEKTDLKKSKTTDLRHFSQKA